ncbi:MAG: hypothetical protein WC522_00250 [Candidatus Omnitrophota bacterium]
MRAAVVLHSIKDAEDCVRNKLYEGRILLSTHPSVDVYLKEEHNLDCRCLSRFTSVGAVIDQKKACSDMVDDLLIRLDRDLSPVLGERFGLKLDYFVSLYSYLGKYHLLPYLCFTDCVKKAVESLKPDKIYFYDFKFDSFLKTSTGMSDIAERFFAGMAIEIITVSQSGGRLRKIFVKTSGWVKKIFSRGPKGIWAGIKLRLGMKDFGNGRFRPGRKSIVVNNPLFELDFLKEEMKKYNIFDPTADNGNAGPIPRSDLDIAGLAKDTDDPFIKLLLKDIDEDFRSGIKGYMETVNAARAVKESHGIDLGVWGIPPCWKGQALVYEYLRTEAIKVVGAQHGCLYGDSFQPWHFDSDFKRCDYYLSYGFTADDLKRLYPDKKMGCEILPFGKVKSVKPGKTAKKLDILFPITNSISMLREEMEVAMPHELTDAQIAILEYLNAIDGADVYVKPFAYSDRENCAAISLFKRLKNLNVVNNMTLMEFLAGHAPRAVVMELPSQPLFEVMHLDTEIFLMGTRVMPYEGNALKELTRRVHYSEDASGIIQKLELFLKGRLEKKRDNTFYDHYIHKENTEKNISGLISTMMCR